jgi:hypothetical protein
MTMKHADMLQDTLEALALGNEMPASGPAEEILPAVETARWLTEAAPAFEPRPGFVRASRRRLQAQVCSNCGRNPWLMWRWSALYWWQSPTLHVALVVLMVTVIYFNIAGMMQSSRSWLPGDPLYPLKPVVEETRLLLSFSPQRDAELHIEYAHRRLIEVQALVFENRYDEIPATVANFDHHVSRAVLLVDQVAGAQKEQARGLASSLESTLVSQIGMVALLAEMTPEPTHADFKQLLEISTGGVDGIQQILSPDSSDTQPGGLTRIDLGIMDRIEVRYRL